MRRALDRKRPYGIVCGGPCEFFEQDGILFDPQGFEVGGKDIPEETVETRPETPVQPIPDHQTSVMQEVDEDVELETLHDKLKDLGVKFHHRAGIPTLRKLLDSALMRKAETEARMYQ